MTATVTLRPLDTERDEAVAVLARGMRDNPLHVAAFGSDPAHRLQVLQSLFGFIVGAAAQPPVCAYEDDVLVGVCVSSPPAGCIAAMAGGPPPPLSEDPEEMARLGEWTGEWIRRDPADVHWHLGPLAVDAPHQGRGIGSRLLDDFCRRMDEAGEASYLETDKPENVRLYERFGFEIVDSSDVIGVRNWFMRRS